MPANIFDFKAASYIYILSVLTKTYLPQVCCRQAWLADLLKIISFLGQYCIVKEDIDIFWTFVKN